MCTKKVYEPGPQRMTEEKERESGPVTDYRQILTYKNHFHGDLLIILGQTLE